MTQIKLLRDELLRQRVEQFGMRRWIGGAEIIDGIDNAAPHQVIPNAVDLGFGEERILRTRDPLRQRLQISKVGAALVTHAEEARLH